MENVAQKNEKAISYCISDLKISIHTFRICEKQSVWGCMTVIEFLRELFPVPPMSRGNSGGNYPRKGQVRRRGVYE